MFMIHEWFIFTDSYKLFKIAVGLMLLLFVGMTHALTIPISEASAPSSLETSKRQTTGEKHSLTNISITCHLTKRGSDNL